MVICVPHTKKCGVSSRQGLYDDQCPSSCQVPKWWDIRVLGLVRLILKLLKKQETRLAWQLKRLAEPLMVKMVMTGPVGIFIAIFGKERQQQQQLNKSKETWTCIAQA